MRIAIIDDNHAIHRAVVDSTIGSEKFNDLEIEFVSYFDAESFLKDDSSTSFLILILDVELPGIDGVKLSKQLQRSHRNTKIIFLTSHEHYIRDAFGLNVHQYIFKKELEVSLPIHLSSLISSIENEKGRLHRFNTKDGTILIFEENIVCIVFEDRNPVIYTNNQERFIIVGLGLNAVYDKIDYHYLIKANSGTIINVEYVKRILKNEVFLEYYEYPIIVARGRMKKVQSVINELEFESLGRLL